MSTETELLAAVLARPDEDTPRLAYADWLDDHADSLAGRDPKEARARAEFIRLQIACEGRDDDPDLADARDRAALLLQRHYEKWRPKARIAGTSRDWDFFRGFAERPLVKDDFPEVAEQLLAIAPVRRLRLYLKPETILSYAACPYLQRIRALDLNLWGTWHSVGSVSRLLVSPYLAELRELGLPRAENDAHTLARTVAESESLVGLDQLNFQERMLSEAAAVELARAKRLRPRRLTNHGSQLNDGGAMALAASPLLSRLEVLSLRRCRIGPAGAKALVESPHLGLLWKFDIGGNTLGRECITALANSSRFVALRSLNLGGTGIEQHGVAALASSTNLRNLRQLWLWDNRLRAGAARAIAEGVALTRLHELKVDRNGIGDGGAAHLASSPHLCSLRRLSLEKCSIKEVGAKALAEGTAFRALTHLDMGENKIGDVGAAALAQGHFPELRELAIANCGIGDAGFVALARSPLLANVEVLEIDGNRITDVGAKALLKSPYSTRLRELSAERNKMSRSVRAALEKRFNKPVE
jgi:uncharacterized protein (TIGR02996 family)